MLQEPDHAPNKQEGQEETLWRTTYVGNPSAAGTLWYWGVCTVSLKHNFYISSCWSPVMMMLSLCRDLWTFHLLITWITSFCISWGAMRSCTHFRRKDRNPWTTEGDARWKKEVKKKFWCCAVVMSHSTICHRKRVPMEKKNKKLESTSW